MERELKHNKTFVCPALARMAKLIGDRWSILIVYALLDGPRRFNELQATLVPSKTASCINSRTLTIRLKLLEQEGIISRTAFEHAKPPRVEYAITKKGQELSEIIERIHAYGRKHST